MKRWILNTQLASMGVVMAAGACGHNNTQGSGNANVDTAVANKGAGKSVLIKLTAHTSDNTFVWNSSWIFIGEKPASIAANKTALLSVTCFGTSETDVICSYAVQD